MEDYKVEEAETSAASLLLNNSWDSLHEIFKNVNESFKPPQGSPVG